VRQWLPLLGERHIDISVAAIVWWVTTVTVVEVQQFWTLRHGLNENLGKRKDIVSNNA
jgi:hypothetical protein